MGRCLLRPEMIPLLTVGDCLMEMNRFTKKYRVYRILEIEDTYAYGEVVVCNDGARKGYTCGMELLAHATHKTCICLNPTVVNTTNKYEQYREAWNLLK